MQYALLIYESPAAFDERAGGESTAYVDAWRAYHRAMVKAGIYLGGNPLQIPVTGATVRMDGERRQVLDGPYAETKEQLGGFVVVDLPSLDAALEWAARCPAAAYGAVEVRAIASDLRRRVTDD